MCDLVARLVEGEIRLGVALVEVAVHLRSVGNTSDSEQARNRADTTYLRARAYLQNLPETAKHTYVEQLQALRRAIDGLPAVPHRADAEPDSVPCPPRKIVDSPA